MIVRMVILAFGDLLEGFDLRTSWVVFHNSESKITCASLCRTTLKEPPRPRQMKLEEIDSNYEPMDDK